MAERQSSRLLFESPLARVYDVVCRTPRSSYGALMLNAVTQIGLPRRGVFLMERRGETAVIDTNTALMLGPEDEYRVAHPTGDGDEGTVLALPPDLVEDAIGRVEGVGNLRPRDHLAICLVNRALRDAGPDQLEAEDATLLLLGLLSRAFADTGNDDRMLGPGQRLRIERARALTGFSHHSHFSARFRSVFGITPSEARKILTQPKLDELRAVLAGPELAECG